MRERKAENANLKRMYADLALENVAIKDVLSQDSGNRNTVREAAGGGSAGEG
jgi:hypothetical protein